MLNLDLYLFQKIYFSFTLRWKALVADSEDDETTQNTDTETSLINFINGVITDVSYIVGETKLLNNCYNFKFY